MSVELRSPDRKSFLHIEVNCPRGVPADSVEVEVEVGVEGFAGRAKVFLEPTSLASFCTSLDALERTRSGRADLSPQDVDFRLSISSMDGAGHLLVAFVVNRYSFVGDRPTTVQLTCTGGFELDPGLLPALAREFRDLAG
jgi:hypothetical protein